MDVEFEFKEKNGGACVTKLLAPGAVCVVPESLGGLPVTELADKVFSGSTVEKVYLPRTLTRIGRYEFYGCEKLQEIHFYGTLREVGGGVFTVRTLYTDHSLPPVRARARCRRACRG